MTDPESVNGEPEEQEGLHISDKRRFDPETYERRVPTPAAEQAAGEPGRPVDEPVTADEADSESEEGEVPGEFVVPDDASELVEDVRVVELESQVRERTEDLQRLQAEYVNYKRRVDRDRDVSRQNGIESVLGDLLAVLDDLRAARAHEDLTGGFKAVAEEIEKVAAKHGLEAYGVAGEAFDPQVHEALMHQPAPEGTEVDGPTVVAVLQPGYRIGERVLRPARVAVTGA
ncbi:nucleotide exchange factor GrpE [Raineyella sp. LH-20]|uniref:nucleotide exchange factor GrpE n=1 Tax=Raineyella sp. LH-20 TaxID=3081204 RepID=UPI0029529A82|nr:nucleotide exchange factor GrpE [Raineyella sp. LH-20]WOP20020.1 nucleotide exchange factor GrpE [Raineyella sp. LH-20]